MSDVMEDWRKLVAPHRKPRGVETTESHWRAHIGPELGQIPVSQLDLRRVQEFVNKISPGRSGKQVENILLTLTGMIRHASKWDKDIKPISVSDLTMPAKVKSKPGFYEVDEIKRLIAAASESGASIVKVQKQLPEWNIQGVDPRGFRSSASKQSEVGGTSK